METGGEQRIGSTMTRGQRGGGILVMWTKMELGRGRKRKVERRALSRRSWQRDRKKNWREGGRRRKKKDRGAGGGRSDFWRCWKGQACDEQETEG